MYGIGYTTVIHKVEVTYFWDIFRYCSQCNKTLHHSRRTMDHITHGLLPSPWDMEQETQNYLVKAVVGLLQEARPFGSNREQEESHRRTMQVLDDEEEEHLVEDEATLNERRLLSRYGVWLLVIPFKNSISL